MPASELQAYAARLREELARCPHMRGTTWYTDRERELAAVERTLSRQ